LKAVVRDSERKPSMGGLHMLLIPDASWDEIEAMAKQIDIAPEKVVELALSRLKEQLGKK
jgi:hypothetical protein